MNRLHLNTQYQRKRQVLNQAGLYVPTSSDATAPPSPGGLHVPPPPPQPVPAPVPVTSNIATPPPPPQTPLNTIDWLQRCREHSEDIGKPMSTLEEEVARILNLPYLQQGLPRCPDRESYGLSMISPTTPDPGFRLRDVQVDAIYTFEVFGGLFGSVTVGGGKTFIAILAAVKAIISRGHARVCIMIPPEVYEQFTERDLPQARKLFQMCGIAFYCCTGSARQRRQVANTAGSGVWIYSYSSLSSKTGYEELKAIGATCYILDEAHNVARATAGRTKRFHTVLTELEQEGIIERTQALTGSSKVTAIEMIALSGTLTKKSVGDYAHLATRALGLFSPAPMRGVAISAFSAAIDAEVTGVALQERDASILRQFLEWARAHNLDVAVPPRRINESDQEYDNRCRVGLSLQEQVRQAYQARLISAPGVVATIDQGVDSSLLIRWIEPPRPDTIEATNMVNLMRQVVNDQVTPGGDTIDYGMHQFKWLWELSAGFYNNLIWPSVEEVVQQYPQKWGKTISIPEGEAMLAQAQYHHGLLQEYHKKLRRFLDDDHLPGCDTPMLVAAEIVRQVEGHEPNHRLPQDLMQAYVTQRNEGPHTYPDLPERYSIPVRVCDYKIRAAVSWAREHGKGLMWYHHPEIGRWLSEYLTAEGIPHTFAPAGDNRAAFNEGLVVASYSHGTGKNLQHQSLNYYVELRREAAIMEQCLGRTHRSGQKADTVEAYVSLGNGFDLAMFGGVLRDADYIQSTMGQRQRLCYADYDPVVPPVNPKLMYRLGIIKNMTSAAGGNSWDQITPVDVQDIADMFRPVAYGISQRR